MAISSDRFRMEVDIVTGHYHFRTLGQGDDTRDVSGGSRTADGIR